MEEAQVSEAEDKLQEERLNRKSIQKTAWLAKKKAISARAVSRRRDRAGMDEVRDDNTILADIGWNR